MSGPPNRSFQSTIRGHEDEFRSNFYPPPYNPYPPQGEVVYNNPYNSQSALLEQWNPYAPNTYPSSFPVGPPPPGPSYMPPGPYQLSNLGQLPPPQSGASNPLPRPEGFAAMNPPDIPLKSRLAAVRERRRLRRKQKELPPFPLMDLNDFNLQKVLRKVKSKSFRRLQQTSWEMWGFIQKNSAVSVFTEGSFSLGVLPETDTSDPFSIGCKIGRIWTAANVKGLYASRLASLQITDVNFWLCQPLCDFFQKYRITCDELILDEIKWPEEQHEKMLATLKPVSVKQISGFLNVFWGLSSPILKNVTVFVDFDRVEEAAKKLLATCQHLKITVPFKGDRETSKQLELYRAILSILLSEPKPQLQQFTLDVCIEPLKLPSKRELKNELKNFSLKKVNGTETEIHAHLKLPEHYPKGSRCEFTLKRFQERMFHLKQPAGIIFFERG